jgi:hypothetical protein
MMIFVLILHIVLLLVVVCTVMEYKYGCGSVPIERTADWWLNRSGCGLFCAVGVWGWGGGAGAQVVDGGGGGSGSSRTETGARLSPPTGTGNESDDGLERKQEVELN